MKKTLLAMVATSVLLLAATGAEAQTQTTEDNRTVYGITFDSPERAQCVAACFLPETPLVPVVEKKAKKKRAKKAKKRKCPPCCVVLKRHVKELRNEIEKLTSQVGLLGKKDADLDARIVKLEKAVKDLESGMDEHTYFIFLLEEDVKDLKRRLTNLERLVRPVRVSPEVGFIGFLSNDKTTYTGFPVGVRLAVSFTEHLEIGSDLAMLVSGGDRHFGSMARGFLGVTFPQSRFSLETGFSGAWCGYNDQAEAQALFITGDLGIRMTIVEGFFAGFTGHLGGELDKDDPAFAWGLGARLGYEF
jgi:hypothetical protein